MKLFDLIQVGHVDFYPNGGMAHQPGCEDEDQMMDLEDVFNSLGLFTETTNPKK